jgi:hypothetical protein
MDLRTIKPFLRLTASAARVSPRIITPSMTACPPYRMGRFCKGFVDDNIGTKKGDVIRPLFFFLALI